MSARTPGLLLALLPPQLQLPWRSHQDLVGKHQPLHPVTTPAQAWPPPEGPQPGLHISQPSCHCCSWDHVTCILETHDSPVFRFKSFASLVQGSPRSALPYPALPPRPPAIPSSSFYISSWHPAACLQLPPARASAQISVPGGSLPR